MNLRPFDRLGRVGRRMEPVARLPEPWCCRSFTGECVELRRIGEIGEDLNRVTVDKSDVRRVRDDWG